MELYQKYRPRKLKDVIGQEDAVKQLTALIDKGKVPHALMFTGPSGTGKTTLARVLKKLLGCRDSDYQEINAAESRGIDTIREIIQRMGLAPMGKCRIWLIDEVHRVTVDAQNAMLKMLEDGPAHAYFILCTTDSSKIIKTVHGRCTEVVLKNLSPSDVEKVLKRALDGEGREVGEKVVELIVERAEGSGRKALVLLEQVLDLDSDEDRLESIQKAETKAQAIEIARALMEYKVKWDKVAGVLINLDEDPEQVRRMILAYAGSVALKNHKLAPKAYLILTAFEGSFFETGATGKASLVRACWEVAGNRD